MHVFIVTCMHNVDTSNLSFRGQKQLSLSVCGKANDGQSEWKIQHVRQCIQKQYEWRPEKK